jgi:hypothetical protein
MPVNIHAFGIYPTDAAFFAWNIKRPTHSLLGQFGMFREREKKIEEKGKFTLSEA